MARLFDGGNVWLIALAANSACLLAGFDFGATSWLLLALKDEGDNDDAQTVFQDVSESAALQGMVVSCTVFGACVACMALFFWDWRISWRTELRSSAMLFSMGSMLVMISTMVSWNTPIGLLALGVGRVLYGFGTGFAMHSAGPYVSELAPPDRRGRLGSLVEIFFVVGVLLGYVIGSVWDGWMGMMKVYFFPMALAMTLMTVLVFIPRSPRFLLQMGESRDVVLAALTMIDESATMRDVDVLAQELAAETEDVRDFWERARTPQLRTALVVGLGCVIAQQLSGQMVLLYYASIILEDSDISVEGGLIGLGLAKLAGVALSVFLVEAAGRRTLLIGGAATMTFSLAMLAIVFLTEHGTALVLAPFYVGTFGYEFGMGPIVWILLAEIYPNAMRNKAVSLAMAVNWGTALVLAILVPIVKDDTSLTFLFFCFAVACFGGTLFVVRYVPETKGLSLEQVQVMLAGHSLRFEEESPLMGDSGSGVGTEQAGHNGVLTSSSGVHSHSLVRHGRHDADATEI